MNTTLPTRRRRRPPRPGQLNSLSPLRILTQILLLQSFYYIAATILLVFSALAAGKPPLGIGLVLDWRLIRGDVTDGWMLGVVWGLVGGVMVIPLLLLIARSKLIPDFALTIHLLHLVATSVYVRQIPSYALWWLVQASSAGVMTALGVWSCRWRELRPIVFGGGGTGGGEGGGRGADAGAQEGNEEERVGLMGGGKGEGIEMGSVKA